jgi:uncharacterized protein (TIRG00374 family)
MNSEPKQNRSASPERRSPRTGTLLKNMLGWAVAAACLAWVFHDVKLDELAQHMTSIEWAWAVLGIGFNLLIYVIQGHRWKMLLRPTGDISVLRTTQAIYVGLFTNTIVPLRVGELVRMFLVSRWMKTDFLSILPSGMVERMLDAVWLAVAVALSVAFVPLPRELLVGELVLVGVIIVAAALFAFAVAKKGRVYAASIPAGAPRRRNLFRFVSRFIDDMATGFHKIGLSGNFFIAAVGSLGVLVFQILALWCVMPAMGIHLSVWEGAVVFLVVRMGTALPNAPSNVGSYQFFTVVALEIFGVDKATAASFSLVSFVLLTIPIAIVGLFALWRTGMSFSAIRSEVANLRGNRIKTSRSSG